MYFIQQVKDLGVLSDTAKRLGECTIPIDVSVLSVQESNLDEMESNSTNKVVLNNIKALRKCIKAIKKNTDGNGNFTYCWENRGDILTTYPTMLVDESKYGVIIADAIINDGSKKIVKVSMSQLKNLIALEYGRLELGYDTETLEKVLKDVPIVGFHSVEELRSRMSNFDFFHTYMTSCAVKHSEYLSNDGKNLYGYFNNTSFPMEKDSGYRTVINTTCKTITSLIAANMLYGPRRLSKGATLINVGLDYITFMTDREQDLEILKEDAVIKICGRQISINKQVTII